MPNRFDIPVLINGIPRIALVDTGASISCMRAGLIEPQNCNQTPQIRGYNNRSNTRSKGTAKVEIQIEKFINTVEVVIVDNLVEEVILGYPWLKCNNMLMDLANECIYIGEAPRQAIYRRQLAPAQGIDAAFEEKLQGLQESIREILLEYQDLFTNNVKQSTTRAAQHTIILKRNEIIKQKPYKYSPEKREVIRQEIRKMLEAGVIRPSHSPYSSPIVLVQKKDGEPRFCVDYRKINNLTVSESTALPPIQDTVRELGNAKVFTTMDLKSGYWQVPVDEGSKQYTAFMTPEGSSYEFQVMPFGLKNAPASFQKLMSAVLGEYIDKFCKVYLDDIVVYSHNEEQHQQHLRLVLEKLRSHGLKCSPTKCYFAKSSLDYLGYVIDQGETRPQQKHVTTIQEFPTPKTLKQLRGFLGTAGWLREFISNYAELTAPLTDLTQTKGNKRFRWTPEAENAFQALKGIITGPLTLARPQVDLPFVLQTDASNIGMSAVLYQEVQGKKQIVSHVSAKFKGAELHYHVNELECLAAVFGIKRFRPYLECRKFVLRTDSRSLTWLANFKDSKAKLLRWALLLQEFDFDIEHVPGRDNHLPDFLSRHPDPKQSSSIEDLTELDKLTYKESAPVEEINIIDSKEKNGIQIENIDNKLISNSFLNPFEILLEDFHTPQPKAALVNVELGSKKTGLNELNGDVSGSQINNKNILSHAVLEEMINNETPIIELEDTYHVMQLQTPFEIIAQQQRTDQGVGIQIDKYLQVQQDGPVDTLERRLLERYSIIDGLLFRKYQHRRLLIVPLHMINDVCYQYHNHYEAGHPGTAETLRAIQQHYYWVTMGADVQKYVSQCLECRLAKSNSHQAAIPLRPRMPTRPWQMVSMDTLGPYPVSTHGNQYVYILTDCFSKWVEARAYPAIEIGLIVQFLEEHLIARWGTPETLVTDNGTSFTSNAYLRFTEVHHIKVAYSAVSHQRANPVERRVQELKKILRIYMRDLQDCKWEDQLQRALFCLRTRRNAATVETPSMLLLGYDLPRPGDWELPNNQHPLINRPADHQERVAKAARRSITYRGQLFPNADQPVREYQAGEQVMTRRTFRRRPFESLWRGPNTIIRKLGKTTYEVEREGTVSIVHVDDIRPAPVACERPADIAEENEDDEEED